MKRRTVDKIENINWNDRFTGTMNIMKQGEINAMEILDQFSVEGQRKVMDDLWNIGSAPDDSVVCKNAIKEIGKDFRTSCYMVYNHLKVMNRRRSNKSKESL